MWLILSLAVTLLAMTLERIFGYPDALFRRIGHPVTWMGAFISRQEARANLGEPLARRRAGRGALGWLLVAVAMVAFPLWFGLWQAAAGLGVLVLGLICSSLIAQHSLGGHVLAVADGLEQSLEKGRQAVAMIVGRDVTALDEAGVARAAIESLAENFSDGVVAPVFWMAFAGLPGAALYKAINTADSMIGHRNSRYIDYGRAAARLDDWVNWPAARLTGGVLWLAAMLLPGASPRGALRAMRRDARAHRSPNAGWPEAAMAGALGFSLAGTRVYEGVVVADAEMNPSGRRTLTAADIRRALRLYWLADAILFAMLCGVLAIVFVLF